MFSSRAYSRVMCRCALKNEAKASKKRRRNSPFYLYFISFADGCMASI
jgi:hypothetical protein